MKGPTIEDVRALQEETGEGVCDAEFDTIFEALRFAKELGK